jgi:Mn-dependent DtxR family transcriptional regulator
MFDSHSPRQNRLLAALPADVSERLFPHLEQMPMAPGDVLFEPGRPLRHVHFPTTAIVSLPCIAESGGCGETALIGNEGMVGIGLFLGGAVTPGRAVVERMGFGYRLNASVLLAEFKQAGPLMHLLLHYTQALIAQMSQTAFCNRHHTLDQQFCRRLLLCLDRLHANELAMKQDWIPGMLGVRSEGMSEIAGKLQRAGLIEYSRNHVTVLDRPALERRACECYAVVREAFTRQLPYPINRTVASAAAQGFEHSASGDWHAHLHAPDFIDARKRQ